MERHLNIYKKKYFNAAFTLIIQLDKKATNVLYGKINVGITN